MIKLGRIARPTGRNYVPDGMTTASGKWNYVILLERHAEGVAVSAREVVVHENASVLLTCQFALLRAPALGSRLTAVDLDALRVV